MQVNDALVGTIILIGEQNRPISIKWCRIDSESVVLSRYIAAASVCMSTRLIQSTVTVPRHKYQFSYRTSVSRSLIITIMTAALTRSSFVEKFQFSENCPSVSDVILISGGRLFHADGPATVKLRGPKPVVLVRGTTRSPWPAEHKWRCVETAETGLIIDTRSGATSWWRHL